ncbi:hypothetical protein Tsubulata_017524 [Turnera subulata]|uniref:Peptidase S54 rhomboid domain-containing protein n=1 Tax=Turnera subulata TaxID=218843 RepID=A0A9Q0J832_9ROSI|nr:hypothetical protein Tsubulata_017524 [Turnera subulata]
MQRLIYQRLSSASSNLSKKLANDNASLLHSQSYKTFASLPKPTHQTTQHPVHGFGSSLTNPLRGFHPCQSQHTLPRKVHGFLSNPVLSRRFFSNLTDSQLRAYGKTLTDCKVRFFQGRFARGFHGFSRNYGRRWTSWFNSLSDDSVLWGLIIANTAVFLLWRMANQRFMMENFMISLDNFKSGRVHTVITSAFSHVDFEHIISNMIGLYFFGTNVGRTFGPEFLLKLYLAGAIGGSVFFLVQQAFLAKSSKEQGMFTKDPSRTPALGASGAVNAIMLLEIFLHPRATLYFDFIIPVPAILLGIFLIGKDVMRMVERDSNISGAAHLGGAAVAALAWYRIRKGRF